MGTVTVGRESWALAEPFAIARGVKTAADTVVVRLSQKSEEDGRAVSEVVGRGESVPYGRYGETPDSVVAQIEALADWIADPARGAPAERRAALQSALPPGAARNAVDCALWDLEAKLTGRRVADLTGLTPPPRAETAVTISLDTPEAMGAATRRAVARFSASLLKAKLGGGDVEVERDRLRAVRAAAPDARLIIDANEGWTPPMLAALDPVCAEINALFIEQPVRAADDAALGALTLTTPICADESCHGTDDLARLGGLFQVVNLKLDKTGGLTEALRLRDAALAQGFGLMIGCMVAGSLATAPAFQLTAGALAVDLDGPLLLAHDREPAIAYDGAVMGPPARELWG